MKISELIRMGAAVTGPMTGGLCNDDKTKTCALGAMLIGACKKDEMDNDDYDLVKGVMGDTAFLKVEMPAPLGDQRPHFTGDKRFLYVAIWMLNDYADYKWTREQIADWLEAQGL